MIKITFNTLFFLFLSLQVYSQIFKIDSTVSKQSYEKKSLSFEEANIVSSFYHQDGNHSAITGGVGTEKLTDFANVIDFKISWKNGKGKKHLFGAEFGVDYYTSASSDNIDYKVSSASSSDVRVYPSLNYSLENAKNGLTVGGNLAFSSEYDYLSKGGGLNLSKISGNKRTEIGARINVFLDSYTQYIPTEFRISLPNKQQKNGNIGALPRNTFDFSTSLSHIISKRLQVSVGFDVNFQSGLLSTPFHRVYKSDGSLFRETLPDQRLKIPIGIRANYFAGEKVIIRSLYRYYKDDWGMNAHTLQIEIPYKITPFYSISPFYRYHQQSAIDYFFPKGEGGTGTQFFSSDYDLSALNSHFYGIGVRHTPFKSVFNLFAISQLELRAALYNRSDGMNAGIVSFHVQFKGF